MNRDRTGLALYPPHWEERHQAPTWPHPQAWPHHQAPGMPADLVLMLGRIAERTEATAAQTERIEARQIEIGERLIRGDARFDAIETQIEEKLAQLTPPPAPPAPAKAATSWADLGKMAIGASALIGAAAGFIPWEHAVKLFGK